MSAEPPFIKLILSPLRAQEPVNNINPSSYKATPATDPMFVPDTSISSPFKRQVYISRVAVYDEKKNLIGIATLANPILKKEDQDLSFKLKLDI